MRGALQPADAKLQAWFAKSVVVILDIDELADGVLQGYSAALDLNLRWEDGRLGWHDTTTG